MNNILLKGVKVIDPSSAYHSKQTNILIENGKISKIGDIQDAKDAVSIDGAQYSVSPGWIDMRSSLSEPGIEHKETIDSLCRTAASGGFTDVVTFPNSKPAVQTKEAVSFIKNRAAFSPVDLHPVAAATKDLKGEEMTELQDLHIEGAIAFSDAEHPMWHLGVARRILQYLKPFDGLLIVSPEETQMHQNGQMHEGITSTLMGTRGIPSLAEDIAIERFISLLGYTGGKIHFSNISTSGAVELIRKAKANGLQVSCDIAAHQIAFTDEDMMGFDTNFKVKPPFRLKSDVEALWEGIKDGTIDAIVSSHAPQDIESKELEFELADFGAIGLQTAFSALMSNKPADVSTEVIIEKLTTGPRGLLKLENPSIVEGAEAKLTIFDEQDFWTFTKENNKSLSNNSPFFGKLLKGKVVGTVNGTKNSLPSA
ncbi:dihydroorotase [Sediminitomix flava]|uniref:Dihydroorotase n=1 Tax=Sediminitomix flava TaxID=379075 RepID=A0A315YXF0_SEDFL|nr:dihydroorotase [Sediminitomix flava]PWJ34157.1 dihydroorotase [Sediminitomix flava]